MNGDCDEYIQSLPKSMYIIYPNMYFYFGENESGKSWILGETSGKDVVVYFFKESSNQIMEQMKRETSVVNLVLWNECYINRELSMSL